MAVPAFEFTDRATPIVQTGRGARPTGELWDTAEWGAARWGGGGWEPAIWTDLTCEVHEITTNTGRGGATDRFVPGTAHIVASNVHQVSEMLFPTVPAPAWESEFVPQPPIDHEEDLQAPTADTVVSNGWSFTDDFQTAPPRWGFPAAHATGGEFPTVPLVWAGGRVEPELYVGADGTWEAHGVAQWTGPYPNPEVVAVAMTVTNLDWASEPTEGTPRAVFDLYVYGNTTSRAATTIRFTIIPDFAGATTATIEPFRMGAAGETVDLIATTTVTSGLGSDGHVVPLVLTAQVNAFSHTVQARINGSGTPTYAPDPSWFAAGDRIGFAVDYYEGDLNADPSGVPHITTFETVDFLDEFDRPTGSGWVPGPRRDRPMLMNDGGLRPPAVWEPGNHAYRTTGAAQWVSEFAGDQFIEAEVSGTDMPHELELPAHTVVELYVKANRRDLSAVVAEIDYLVGWGTDHTMIDWYLYQYGPDGQVVYNPAIPDVSSGSIDYGVTGGVFPQPARWRLEADTDGTVRFYHDRQLIGGPVTFPDLPAGDRIGVYLTWAAGEPDTVGDTRPQPARFNQISGGLREPLGTEELGLWIRIGVDHTTLGNRWFFRGFVDGIVPTYVPDRPDAVRIECIDSLGEAGRVFVDGDRLPDPFAMAPNRVRQILRRAHWPHRFWNVFDDATLMSRPPPGKAVDLLTQVAESCGGAVYGDPASGDVVFKGQDWQGAAAAGEASAWITNWRPDVDIDGLPRICPTGWERSSRRADMNTRVRFTSEASTFGDGEPIIKEWRAPQAETLYGVELYERTLLCATGERLNQLARRQLRLRHPNQFPRIEAVLLDAATEPEALDLMTTATWTRPDKFGCQLRRGDGFVFNRRMIVTGVRHQMSPTRWTCRLALDPASVFAESGGRWGEARWSRGEWGRTR